MKYTASAMSFSFFERIDRELIEDSTINGWYGRRKRDTLYARVGPARSCTCVREHSSLFLPASNAGCGPLCNLQRVISERAVGLRSRQDSRWPPCHPACRRSNPERQRQNHKIELSATTWRISLRKHEFGRNKSKKNVMRLNHSLNPSKNYIAITLHIYDI